MNKNEKKLIIDELTGKFSSSSSSYIINASGLSVEEVNEFRKLCFSKDISYKVAKNTLISLALEKAGKVVDDASFNCLVLKGFSGVLFCNVVGGGPASIIKDFRKLKGVGVPLLKGALVDGDVFVGDEYLDMLSNLKSKEELIANVISSLLSSGKSVFTILLSSKKKLGNLIEALLVRG